MRLRRGQRGAAVVDFCLVMIVLVPLVLGVMQVALVLHVRNTMTAAASEGARYGATVGGGPDAGASRARELIGRSLSDGYATDVDAYRSVVDGYPGVIVHAQAQVPALGLFGPTMTVEVEGHGIEEVAP